MSAIEDAVLGGVDAVHVREHGAAARALHARVRELKESVGDGAWIVVNDRVDVAVAAGADAVQLGGRSLSVADVRRVAATMPVGVSIHSVEDADQPADFFVLGTIYASRSHPGELGAGPSLVARANAASDRPIIAIGGITPENVGEVLAAGAHGVAVISSILDAPSPRDAARRFRERLP